MIEFETQLRNAGATVSATSSLDATRALSLVGLSDRGQVANALRATLLTDHRDAELLDTHFPSFWRRLRDGIEEITTVSTEITTASTDGETPMDHTLSFENGRDETGEYWREEPDGEDHDRRVHLRPSWQQLGEKHEPDLEDVTAHQYSPIGVSEHIKDTPVTLVGDDLAAIDRFLTSLARGSGRRRQPGSGQLIDTRRALRASLATGGTPLKLPTQTPVKDQFRCSLLLDVSRSITRYSRSWVITRVRRATPNGRIG